MQHYLKAIDAIGSDDGATVNQQMRKMPVDFLGRPATIRADGRVLYDMTLYQVKMPDESRYHWDDYKILRTIPAAEAFRAPDPAVCPLAKGS